MHLTEKKMKFCAIFLVIVFNEVKMVTFLKIKSVRIQQFFMKNENKTKHRPLSWGDCSSKPLVFLEVNTGTFPEANIRIFPRTFLF